MTLSDQLARAWAYDDGTCGAIALVFHCPEGEAENKRLTPLLEAMSRVVCAADKMRAAEERLDVIEQADGESNADYVARAEAICGVKHDAEGEMFNALTSLRTQLTREAGGE
jgi:hypothetical protein